MLDITHNNSRIVHIGIYEMDFEMLKLRMKMLSLYGMVIVFNKISNAAESFKILSKHQIAYWSGIQS